MSEIPAEAAIRADERARIAASLRAHGDAQGLWARDLYESEQEIYHYVADLVERGELAFTPARVGSPVSCPSAAPESTQSPETASVAPVYPPDPERPAETLSALRGRYAAALAATCKLHEIEGECPACERRLTAVLAVRDDELSRALRIADYHAGQHRQAAERADRMAEMVIEKDREATQWADWLHQAEATIARVREACLQVTSRQVRDDGDIGEQDYAMRVLKLLDGAGAVSEEQTGDLRQRLVDAKLAGRKTPDGYQFNSNERAADLALAVFAEEQTGHACGNCEGIDPASCINAPRPPASTTEETSPHG